MLESALNFLENHFGPPRHDFKPFEVTGIQEFIGPTVIVANILLAHGKTVTEVDISKRETAVWLTTPKEINGRKYDLIIGADGKASKIAVDWNDGQPDFFLFDEVNMEVHQIEGVRQLSSIKASNLPDSASAAIMLKNYDEDSLNKHQLESYTVLRMPVSYNMNDSICLKPFAAKETLVSGKNNRGFGNRISTSWWAVSNVSWSNLPFARNLKLKK